MKFRLVSLVLAVFATSAVKAEDVNPNAVKDVNFAANYYPGAALRPKRPRRMG